MTSEAVHAPQNSVRNRRTLESTWGCLPEILPAEMVVSQNWGSILLGYHIKESSILGSIWISDVWKVQINGT